MITQQPAHTQVSPETNLTIAERCADPGFQKIVAQAFPRWWEYATSETRMKLAPSAIAQAIINQICDGHPTESHPEYRALVAMFERGRAQVADQ